MPSNRARLTLEHGGGYGADGTSSETLWSLFFLTQVLHSRWYLRWDDEQMPQELRDQGPMPFVEFELLD